MYHAYFSVPSSESLGTSDFAHPTCQNLILMTQNADRLLPGGSGPVPTQDHQVPAARDASASPGGKDVAARTAARTLAARTAGYTNEVRRLLDAGLVVVIRNGTSSRPRVADIVAEAGLSNDAFYRHFPSKDALVAALIEDGAERLASYVDHQMSKEPTPAGKVRRWVEAVLAQAMGDVAKSTLAVLWNGSGSGDVASGRHPAAAPLAVLLHEPFAALGSEDPVLEGSLASHATLGTLSDHLWRRAEPTEADVERITRFLLRAVTGAPAPDAP
jgi:AcrR family transcriptional regulator